MSDTSILSQSTSGFPAPVPHPEPVACKVRRAREALSEALEALVSVQDEISRKPGTRPERTPEWWLGYLQGLSSYLLLTLEDQDAVNR